MQHSKAGSGWETQLQVSTLLKQICTSRYVFNKLNENSSVLITVLIPDHIWDTYNNMKFDIRKQVNTVPISAYDFFFFFFEMLGLFV